MEESYFLQASLDSSDGFSERRIHGEPPMSSYYVKSMIPNAFEAALRQKEGELASYMSRLVRHLDYVLSLIHVNVIFLLYTLSSIFKYFSSF